MSVLDDIPRQKIDLERLLIVMTSIDNEKIANKLAKEIVKEKLAACVSITKPVISCYVWNNKQENVQEYLMLIKTIPENYHALQIFLENNHPYEVPEIIGIQTQNYSQAYFDWVVQQTKIAG